jgi:hypothetical protein
VQRPNPGKVPVDPRHPNPGRVPPDPRHPTTRGAQRKPWTFSFRFWNQIQNFGLDKSPSKWFVSVLERFRELSKYSVDEFRDNGKLRDNWRYHSIKWDMKNVPIGRKDCSWIDSDYLDNEDEYPLVQFQISQALGRVVGFWDESDVFNIVLLDPLHNIQPSSYSDYKVRPCGLLDSKHTELLVIVDEITHSLGCDRLDCKARHAASKVPISTDIDAIIVPIDDRDKKDIEIVLKNGSAKSVSDVFRNGLLAAMTGPEPGNTP